jgi:hypothetical protein
MASVKSFWPLMALLTLPVVSGSGVVAQVPAAALSDKEVSQAIDKGPKQQVTSVCVGKAVPGEFTICFQGPEQRIWVAATSAKQAQRKLRPADIADDLRIRTWLVVVRPNRPGLVEGQPTRTPSPEEVSLNRVGQAQTGSIKPLRVSRVTFEWDNARGVTLRGEGLSATFDPAPLPLGDVEVMVSIEGSGERRYVLTDAERSQVR